MSFENAMSLRSQRERYWRKKERYVAMYGLSKRACWWPISKTRRTPINSTATGEERIVAMEDTIVFRMSKKDLFSGMASFPDLLMLTTLIIIKYYCESKFNETFLRMKKPHCLFQHMLTGNPEVLQRGLQRDIATFLGVSEPLYRQIKSGQYKHKNLRF
jgi:hypothetical protein